MENNNQDVKKEKTIIKFNLFTILFLIFLLVIVFTYIFQSTKQIYLTYKINELYKQIDELNIQIKELKIENEKLKNNELIEKVAQEKFGMVYPDTNKVVVVKEKATETSNVITEEEKIKIYVNSLYQAFNKYISDYNELSQKLINQVNKK